MNDIGQDPGPGPAASGEKTGRIRDGSMKTADFVSALARGLDVIRLFDADHIRLSVAEVAERTGLSRAAARRTLLTLEQLGYAHLDGDRFLLMPKVLELGHSFVSSWRIPELVRPNLVALVERWNENCAFGVLDRDDVLNLTRVEARRILRTFNIVGGSRTPAAVGSIGRVMLAHLSEAALDAFLERRPLEAFTDRTVTDPEHFRAILAEVRDDGYALVDGELEEGLIAIAAPVRDRHGRVIAAVNFGLPTARMDRASTLALLKDPLIEMAGIISRQLAMAGVDEAFALLR